MRPTINANPPAQSTAQSGERIIEVSDSDGNAVLISLRSILSPKILEVTVYRPLGYVTVQDEVTR